MPPAAHGDTYQCHICPCWSLNNTRTIGGCRSFNFWKSVAKWGTFWAWAYHFGVYRIDTWDGGGDQGKEGGDGGCLQVASLHLEDQGQAEWSEDPGQAAIGVVRPLGQEDHWGVKRLEAIQEEHGRDVQAKVWPQGWKEVRLTAMVGRWWSLSDLWTLRRELLIENSCKRYAMKLTN